MGGGSSYGIIGEAISRHHCGIIQVAAVNHDGILEFIVEAAEIQVGELLPFSEDQQSIGVGGRLVGGARKFNAGAHHFLRALHGGRVVGGDSAAFLHKCL